MREAAKVDGIAKSRPASREALVAARRHAEAIAGLNRRWSGLPELEHGHSAFEGVPGRAESYRAFQQVLTDGRGLGIHVALTADCGQSVPTSLQAMIQRRIVLRMADEDGYALLGMPRDILGPDAAPGRAILSRVPPEEARSLLERSRLQAFTPQTVHTVDALAAQLETARRLGYATAWEEFFPGDLSVAAAVLDQTGRLVAAVNIGVSSARYTAERAEEVLAPLVVAAARSISQASSPF